MRQQERWSESDEVLNVDWQPIGTEVQLLTANQQRIKDMLEAGKGIWSICGIMRMRREHVIDEIYEIRKKEASMANKRGGGGKLTTQQKAAIYQAYKDGMKQGTIAQQYGVCRQAVAYTIKKMREAEESMAAAVDLPAAAQVPAPEPERKPAAVNQEFENAIDKMIEDAKAEKMSANAEKKSAIAEVSEPEQDPKQELEDVEDGIPNTPLVPADVLPPVVRRAVDGHLAFIADRIEALQYRISEIEIEIEEYRKDAERLEEWKEQQKWR